MFMELGMKLDNLLQDMRLWNTKRAWYKPYAWYFINKKIKTNSFKSEKTFNAFMDAVKYNNQIWDWQYKLLCKMHEGRIISKGD